MAAFKSVPTIATKRDIASPVNRKPENEIKASDLEVKKKLTQEQADKMLEEKLDNLVKEEAPEPQIVAPKANEKEEEVLGKAQEEVKSKVPVKEAPKPQAPKKVEIKKEEPKKEEPLSKEPVKEEPVNAIEPIEKDVTQPEPERPLTPEEKKAKQLENLKKARLAAQARKERENEIMAAKKEAPQAKKPVVKPKKTVDMSKMTTVAKKPQQSASTKTVYHVSKRGETLDDRVWKVFIQESSKVIKLFDTQAEALAYAKQLAKNKDDGSYVVLHGLDGKIRKY